MSYDRKDDKNDHIKKDEKIINFQSVKDKVKDSDIEKLESYMYSLYMELASGKITMFEFTKKISKYMDDNGISKEKFVNMEKEILLRYGFDPDNLQNDDKALKDLIKEGEAFLSTDENLTSDTMTSARKLSFFEQHVDKIEEKKLLVYYLENEKNNVEIHLGNNKMTLISENKIDLSDSEINLLIAEYRSVCDEKLTVVICEATNKYDYF